MKYGRVLSRCGLVMKSLPRVGVFSIDVLVNTVNEKLVFIPGVADLLLSVIRDDMHVAIATEHDRVKSEGSARNP